MKTEKFITKTEEETREINLSSDDFVAAITSLLEVLHQNGLDAEAAKALAGCGIEYEYEVE